MLWFENRLLTESNVMICFVCHRGKRTQPTISQATPKRQKHDSLTEDMLDPFLSVQESPAASPSLLENNNGSETNDDLIIMEKTMTPNSGKPGFESIKVKVESNQSNIDMLSECGNSTTRDDSTPLEPSSNIGAITMCKTTQTEMVRVKEEPQSQNPGNIVCVKQQLTEPEIHNRTQGENLKTQKIQKEETHAFKGIYANSSTRRSSPQHFLNLTQLQEKEHQLQVALQTAAEERDSLKEQVQTLSVQLQETQDRLKELLESTGKKEYFHQSSQKEDGKNYKDLFRKVRQKIDQLIKDNVFEPTTPQAEPSAVQGEEKDFNDMVQPVEFLIQELKQRSKERDELCSQVSLTDNGIWDLLIWKQYLGLLGHVLA